MEPGPDLRRWEPPSGILADYERLWTPTSDAPRVYHVAGGLAAIAGAVENRLYLPFGGERIYPNLWNLILGPSSFFRKSTCIAKARKTLAKVNPDALLPDEFSREALLKRLSTRGQGLLTYSEFSGVLATFRRDYMSGATGLLTDLYDCPATYSRVVGQNEFKAAGVCLSILAASQTGWFLEKLKGGGRPRRLHCAVLLLASVRKEALSRDTARTGPDPRERYCPSAARLHRDARASLPTRSRRARPVRRLVATPRARAPWAPAMCRPESLLVTPQHHDAGRRATVRVMRTNHTRSPRTHRYSRIRMWLRSMWRTRGQHEFDLRTGRCRYCRVLWPRALAR